MTTQKDCRGCKFRYICKAYEYFLYNKAGEIIKDIAEESPNRSDVYADIARAFRTSLAYYCPYYKEIEE